MLDKSVPYAGLFMRKKAGTPPLPYTLPQGYSFAFWNEGDETSWARIETSVLEFDSEFAALMRFAGDFLPYKDELRRRCIFIENGGGVKIATSTAWWRHVDGEIRPWLFWVGVDPEYQGLGLGKAIISRALELLTEFYGDADFYLHTQTWSHKAIGIYVANGFKPTNEKTLYKNNNSNYKKAMKILREIEVSKKKG